MHDDFSISINPQRNLVCDLRAANHMIPLITPAAHGWILLMGTRQRPSVAVAMSRWCLKGDQKVKKKVKCLAPNQVSIVQCWQQTNGKEKLETAMKADEIKLAGFLAEHNIAMRSADHLVDVIKDIFKDSKTAQGLKPGRMKATAINKHVIGDCYFEVRDIEKEEIQHAHWRVNRHWHSENTLHCCPFLWWWIQICLGLLEIGSSIFWWEQGV